MNTELANSLLPQKKTQGIIDPAHLKYLLITPPKFGKTTTACSIPDSVLLACEEGHAFVSTHKIIIDQWDRPWKEKQNGIGEDDDGNYHMSMAEAVEIICASDRFAHVVIDTADMAARMCVDYHCALLKVPHPQDAGDFGKGYALTLTDPFRRMIGPIIKSGRGITFTSHSKWVERKQGGVTVGKWESTLPSQAQTFLHSQADLIWFGKFGKHRPGMEERDRIVSMDASQETMAGSRVRFEGRPWPIPKNFILDPIHGWEQWCSFFPKITPEMIDPLEQQEAIDVARNNCEAAYKEYLELSLGVKAKETEEEIAAAAAVAHESPAPSEAAEPEAKDTPSHLETPKNVKRRKSVAA